LLYACIKDNTHHLTARHIRALNDAHFTTMVAPIGLASECIGAVTVERPYEDEPYEDDDLNYLIGLARGAAPFFRNLERTRQLESDVVRFQSARRESLQFVGTSEAAQRLLYLIRIVARSDQPILVIGETGTGKELVAALIHELSDRARGPFIAVNCAAIPQELFESEVFGHEKGAFTGASKQRSGLLEQSDGGTLFLDEVGDLHPSHQARLLRSVESGVYRRVGGEKDLRADFRVVAATNKNLARAAETGVFREDLYHRLKGLQLNVPPLRDRHEDVPLLVEYFTGAALRRAKRPIHGFTAGALALLERLPWPGNIRELKHCVETAITLAPDAYIDEQLIELIVGEKHGAPRLKTLAEMERDHIEHIFNACGGKVAEAARILGIGRSTLYDKLNHYEITR
jgi:DNA-binding NtrC family response regulator